MAHIGFIGLGHMGLPMAINLLKAGHIVIGYDQAATARDAFLAAGGKVASELGGATYEQDAVITMVQTGEQVKQICLNETGWYKNSPHTLHIDCSTIDVETARYLSEQASYQQIDYLDAPVSGGVAGAQAGSLTFMVGGSNVAVDKARPILNAMGSKIFHAGDVGSGQAAKICNNMILGITMLAVSEAFVLAKKLALPADKLAEVVNNSSGQCWVTSKYLPVPNVLPNVPANNHYQPGFTSAMMLKDLLLSQHAAEHHNQALPLATAATALYEKFNQIGGSNLDFSAIITMLEQNG